MSVAAALASITEMAPPIVMLAVVPPFTRIPVEPDAELFIVIVLPLSRSGFITASILGFAHTMGEFGVVLMLGGNIPGKTRTVSVQIFDHVESMEYAQAHWLAGGMLVFSFVVLLVLYGRRRGSVGGGVG